MAKSTGGRQLCVFNTPLGWMALLETGGVAEQLASGHDSPLAAQRALGEIAMSADTSHTLTPLAKRIKAYANGKHDDFLDVSLALEHLSPFQKRVILACRKIPVGKTVSYKYLAGKAGSPRASRAVGNVMRSNRLPILVPCHRVVTSSGGLGNYSGPQGIDMKRRLLDLEIHSGPKQAKARSCNALEVAPATD